MRKEASTVGRAAAREKGRCARWCASIAVLVAVAGYFAPDFALAWSSVENLDGAVGTHQILNDKAYRRLEKHPALRSSRFPSLPEIQAQSGVGPLKSEGGIVVGGAGPDNPIHSFFSWHYYNPATGRGKAPEAADRYARLLAMNQIEPAMVTTDPMTKKPTSVARNAAYAAHYIQDMTCAFHVVGIPREREPNLDQRSAPSPAVLGPWAMYDDNRWRDLVARAKASADEKTDWFDPTYYDGRPPHAVQGSTHFSYEGVVAVGYWFDKGPRDPLAKSAESAAYRSDIWRGPLQVSQFAKALALETQQQLNQRGSETNFSALEYQMRLTPAHVGQPRDAYKDLRGYIRLPYTDWERAIAATYTVWRGSFSALRIGDRSIRLQPTNRPGVYTMSVQVTSLEPDVPAENVRVSFFVTGEASGQGEAVVGRVSKTSDWVNARGDVRLNNPRSPRGEIQIDISGDYGPLVPDSGVHRIVVPLTAALVVPPAPSITDYVLPPPYPSSQPPMTSGTPVPAQRPGAACAARAATYHEECNKIYKACVAQNCRKPFSDCANQCGSCSATSINYTFTDYWCKLDSGYLPAAETALKTYVGEVQRCVNLFLAGQLREPFFRDQQIGYCLKPHAQAWETRWKKALDDACAGNCAAKGRRGVVKTVPIRCECS